MASRWLALCLSAWAVVAAQAQTTRPAEEGYTGVLTGTRVYVRSAPVDGYPCTQLSRPARVRVVAERAGWLKILPPEGCYSLISKRYVRVQGKRGTVTGNNVLVRAGSDLAPGRMDMVQTRLNAGATVTILGEPIMSTILAYLILREAPTPLKIAGGVLVLAGIYVARQAEGRGGADGD